MVPKSQRRSLDSKEDRSVLVVPILSPVSSEQATTVTKGSRNSRRLFKEVEWKGPRFFIRPVSGHGTFTNLALAPLSYGHLPLGREHGLRLSRAWLGIVLYRC